MCQADLGKGKMRALMRSAVYGHSVVHYLVVICAMLLQGLDVPMPESTRLGLVQSPLYMQMDVGFEPTDINETIRLCQDPESYNVRGVESMLQVYGLVRLDNSKPTGSEGAYMAAVQTRERMNAMGQRDNGLVILNIVNTDEMVIQLTLFIPRPPIPNVHTHGVFLGQTRPAHDGDTMPPKVADYIKCVFPNFLSAHLGSCIDDASL